MRGGGGGGGEGGGGVRIKFGTMRPGVNNPTYPPLQPYSGKLYYSFDLFKNFSLHGDQSFSHTQSHCVSSLLQPEAQYEVTYDQMMSEYPRYSTINDVALTDAERNLLMVGIHGVNLPIEGLLCS